MKLIKRREIKQTNGKRPVLSETQAYIELKNLAEHSEKNENGKYLTISLKSVMSKIKDCIQNGAVFGAIDILNIIEYICKVDLNYDFQSLKDVCITKLETSDLAVVSFAAAQINNSNYLKKAFSIDELKIIERIIQDFKIAKDSQHV